jgi:3-demethoxyubiquinol 3-hydroxylase
MTPLDTLITQLDNALRTVVGATHAARPRPQVQVNGATLTPQERALSAALMRVNHVGEVCAQALYHAQSSLSRAPEVRQKLQEAAREEGDHLAWTQARIEELGGRTSLLVPVWYAGAYGVGLMAASLGDGASLGFVAETERQVEAHLAGHLEQLPENDHASRAIVAQMRLDEAEHARAAIAAGGTELPIPLRGLMKLAAKVMTTTAHRI